jgi:hypothetical protein
MGIQGREVCAGMCVCVKGREPRRAEEDIASISDHQTQILVYESYHQEASKLQQNNMNREDGLCLNKS